VRGGWRDENAHQFIPASLEFNNSNSPSPS
jgi:hypothetical protein